MDDERKRVQEMGDFTLGKPALVCRWRLAGRQLPLEARHMRALASRRVRGHALPAELLAWVRQHLEWTLVAGSVDYPDGVLMLIVDENLHAAMTIGPYEPPAHKSVRYLSERACASREEARITGVAPELLWLVHKDYLVVGAAPDESLSGANSLIAQLAATLGMAVVKKPSTAEEARLGRANFDEAFFVSDEHGVLVCRDAPGPRSRKFAESYERLCRVVSDGRRPR